MAEEEEFSKLPLPDQFAHKNWKARKGGYEIAAQQFKTCQPNAPIVREFNDGQLWKAAVSDSNVAAQQEALSAYNAFLDASGNEGARRTRGSTISGVVEKGLTGRPAAKTAATETLLLLIELDKADPVVDELLPFLAHKQPKVIAATLVAVTAIFHAYGCKVVEPKPVVKLLPKIYAHADKNVRAEGQNLTVELYRWLREAMKPLFWNELKEVQQKDLEKLFEPIKGEPVPKQERLLRSQQAAKEEAEAVDEGGEPGEEEGEDDGAIDLEPEYEAVDVLAKIPKDFGERLASTKWKDRKEALDDLFTAVNVPAIKDGSFDEIVRGLAKSMKDANIAVVTVAANCVESIAKGLRRSFAKYRSTILTAMLERFKEKKASVTDAIGAACDAVFMSTGLGEIEADVLEALKNKNPQIKEHSAKFMIRSLKTTREAPTPEQTKEIAEAGKKLLTESVATLRDAGAEILGVLWKIMGDRNMLSHLDGLDDIRKTKIKEFSDAAEVKAKWKPKAAPAPKAAAAPAGRKPAAGAKKPAAGTKKAAPARAASPPLMEEPALQARPSSRPAAKPGAAGLKPPGIKPPSGLTKPGSGLKAPGPVAATSSPKRQGGVYDDQIQPPKPTPANRGLAARPLGKPPASPPPSDYAPPQQSAMSSVERQELLDLRTSVQHLQQQTNDLRAEKMKLQSQITELQNQNAQLIEDHTRDVLQIKAKETQLVRARSDAENAGDRASALSRECDRLKREMGRLSGRGRAGSGDVGSLDLNGDVTSPSPARPGYGAGANRSYHVPHASRGTASSGGEGWEGKENVPDVRDGKPGAFPFQSAAANSHARPLSNGNVSSGRATPGSMDGGESGGLQRSGSQGGEGVESWRRAAEVTQNLKARIEMMKARQNIGRGQ